VIPPFKKNGYLPVGIYLSTWEEISSRYGITDWRRQLLTGLSAAIDELRAAGCRRVYIDGSFVTAKEHPGDFDACWDEAGVNTALLHPSLVEETFDVGAQKTRYGGELYAVNMRDVGRYDNALDYFQRDSKGRQKGIIAIDLEE
jgi:hypothetical protein